MLATTSLALGDVDNDTDVDLVVGNRGQQNRLYLNAGGTFGAGTGFGAVLDTTALALGNFDPADATLELVVGTQLEWPAIPPVLRRHLPGRRSPSTLPPAAPSTPHRWPRQTSMPTATLTLRLATSIRPIAYYLNSNMFGDTDPNNDWVGHDATSDNRTTFAVALGNIDDDDVGMDLVTGNDRLPGRLYLWKVVEGVGGYLTGSDIGIDPELLNNA